MTLLRALLLAADAPLTVSLDALLERAAIGAAMSVAIGAALIVLRAVVRIVVLLTVLAGGVDLLVRGA